MDLDFSELRAFAAEVRNASHMAGRQIRPVVNKGALNIKNQLRDEMASSRHFKGVASAISYDLDPDSFGAEIGPSSEGGSPGNLANIAYFGGSNGGGGTVPDPSSALEAEGPRFIEALGDAVEALLS